MKTNIKNLIWPSASATFCAHCIYTLHILCIHIQMENINQTIAIAPLSLSLSLSLSFTLIYSHGQSFLSRSLCFVQFIQVYYHTVYVHIHTYKHVHLNVCKVWRPNYDMNISNEPPPNCIHI